MDEAQLVATLATVTGPLGTALVASVFYLRQQIFILRAELFAQLTSTKAATDARLDFYEQRLAMLEGTRRIGAPYHISTADRTPFDPHPSG